MDVCGNVPGRVTFREKMGKCLGLLKSKVSTENGIGEMIVRVGLRHFLELDDDKWMNACGNLLHFFLLRKIKCQKSKKCGFLLAISQ